jgi:acyl carrier protein
MWQSQKDADQEAGPRTSLWRYAITPEEAVQAFDRTVSTATVRQIVVSSGDLAARMDLWIRHTSSADTAYPEHAGPAAASYPRPQLASDYVAPRNAIERRVADIWQQLLGIEQVGIDDNFFALGGHSLLATQLMSRLRDAFQITLPFRSLFEARTVADLSVVIAQRMAEQLDSAVLAELEQLSQDDARTLLATQNGADGRA